MEEYSKDTTTDVFEINILDKKSISSSDDDQSPVTDIDFFHQYDEIITLIGDMRNNLEEIKLLFDLTLQDSTDNESKRNTTISIDKFKSQATKCKNMIKGLEKWMKSHPDPDAQVNQIRDVRYYDVSKGLSDVANTFTAIQSAHQAHLKDRIVKVYEIQGIEITNDEVDRLVESGNMLLMDDVAETENKKKALREIDERRQEILNLETTIRNLAELFTELATLITEQSVIVDRIQYNYQETKDYVQKANVELEQAVKYRIAANKKKIIIIAVCVAILIIIIIIVLASVLPGRI